MKKPLVYNQVKTIAASNSQTYTWTVDTKWDFVLTEIAYVATSASFLIKSIKVAGENMLEGENASANTIASDTNRAKPFPAGWYIRGGSTIEIVCTDYSAVQNIVYLSLIGIKVEK